MTSSETTTLAPRENPDLYGHAAAEQTLHQAFQSGRLPHGWLLTGPRGIGKATLAYRFARFILSKGPQGTDAQGTGAPDSGSLFGDEEAEGLWIDPHSPVFGRVAGGGHGDLLTLERRPDDKGKLPSVISVTEARRAVSFLRRTAMEGGWRVVIVDAIDEMNPNASSALLKILEEPPERAVLLLVSHTPGRLLPTIHSRCCHLALNPLPETTVTDLLASHATGLEPGDAVVLARLSEGSIGHALDLAADGGLDLYRELIGLMATLPGLDVARLHAFGDRLARSSNDAAFRTGMELLIWWLARMIRSAALDKIPGDVVEGEGALMTRLLSRRPLAQWLGLWEKISRRFASAEEANLDRKQVVLSTFLDLEALAS